jgi:phage shock protein A
MPDIMTRIAELVQDLLSGRRGEMPNLDQSIAAAASAHGQARRVLAIAVVEETREIERCASMTTKAADLEDRAVRAIRAGRDDLALAASEAIAAIRSEIEASEQASARFKAEVAVVRTEVDARRRRLSDLDRGRRLASIGRALNSVNPNSGLDRLAEAEEALARISVDNANARAVREDLVPSSERLSELMASQGFGRPVSISAADVMTRLRTMAAMPVLIESARRS